MDEDIILVRKGPLVNKIHKQAEGFRVKDDAIEVFQDQIDLITEMLIDLAVEKVKKDSRKTIMVKDFENSFDEFMKNKLEIDKILDILEASIGELKALKDNDFSKYFEV